MDPPLLVMGTVNSAPGLAPFELLPLPFADFRPLFRRRLGAPFGDSPVATGFRWRWRVGVGVVCLRMLKVIIISTKSLNSISKSLNDDDFKANIAFILLR